MKKVAMYGFLIEVHGNERAMVLVKEVQSEKEARRAAYEAYFGEPKNEEEIASDATIRAHTTVHPLPTVIYPLSE